MDARQNGAQCEAAAGPATTASCSIGVWLLRSAIICAAHAIEVEF
jgi:hypothetical protein